jgi:putative ABC transport system permease protein
MFILNVFMAEALLLCLLGLLGGIGFSYLGVWMVGQWSRSLPILLTTEWMIKAGLISFLSAALGALYPALRAAARDPIDALAFE